METTLGQLVLKSNKHRFLRLCDVNKGKLGIQVEAAFWCIAFSINCSPWAPMSIPECEFYSKYASEIEGGGILVNGYHELVHTLWNISPSFLSTKYGNYEAHVPWGFFSFRNKCFFQQRFSAVLLGLYFQHVWATLCMSFQFFKIRLSIRKTFSELPWWSSG